VTHELSGIEAIEKQWLSTLTPDERRSIPRRLDFPTGVLGSRDRDLERIREAARVRLGDPPKGIALFFFGVTTGDDAPITFCLPSDGVDHFEALRVEQYPKPLTGEPKWCHAFIVALADALLDKAGEDRLDRHKRLKGRVKWGRRKHPTVRESPLRDPPRVPASTLVCRAQQAARDAGEAVPPWLNYGAGRELPREVAEWTIRHVTLGRGGGRGKGAKIGLTTFRDALPEREPLAVLIEKTDPSLAAKVRSAEIRVFVLELTTEQLAEWEELDRYARAWAELNQALSEAD
jgi:hypothetical protein